MSESAAPELRVLFASSEAVPFAKTGGLGDVAGTLPAALQAAGVSMAVILPFYRTIDENLTEDLELVATLAVPMAQGNVSCEISHGCYNDIDFYFVDNDAAFGRDTLYGYDDDNARFALFSRAICEAVAHIPSLACDIIHCNDWQTALVPVYLREFYGESSVCAKVKTVFTIHNAMFQGKGSEQALVADANLATAPVAAAACSSSDGSMNYMRGATAYTDYLTTVSPTYVHELQTPQYGEGLDPDFRRRAGSFAGILNGIDQDIWNPATDSFLVKNYSAANLNGKAACKKALQEELGLVPDPQKPLIVMVSRLTDQKGVGMLCEVLYRFMEREVQVAVLGTGDARYESELSASAAQYPGRMSVSLKFDNALSHRMYAGGDMFLMPSLFEPCGLSQMIAMRYGTLPIVRETGGLKDSVAPYNKYTGEGTGFSFANAWAQEMADITLNACEVYWQNKSAWLQLQHQAMTAEFSWTRAAQDYLAIYRQLVQ